jgi:hypothetical protein
VAISVLGPLQIDGDTTGLGRRDRVVLAALAVRPGEAVPADQLADALWGDDPPPSWPKLVQGCIVRLRKRLGNRAIETSAGGYRLVVGGQETDAQRFEREVRRARELLVRDEAERATAVLAAALAMWHGVPFAELDAWDPGRIEAGRLEELRRSAEETAARARPSRHCTGSGHSCATSSGSTPVPRSSPSKRPSYGRTLSCWSRRPRPRRAPRVA